MKSVHEPIRHTTNRVVPAATGNTAEKEAEPSQAEMPRTGNRTLSVSIKKDPELLDSGQLKQWKTKALT